MRLFDSHTHLYARDFQPDLEDVLQRAREAEVEKMIVVGDNFRHSAEAAAMAKVRPKLFAAVGVHPHDAKTVQDGDYSFLLGLLGPKVVAWGEVGLDYYRDLSPRSVQQQVFRNQIALARQAKLPLIVHERAAQPHMNQILREEKAGEIGGVLHCFSGDWPQASILLDLGFNISFAGNVTYPSARPIQEAAMKIPTDRILVETDCPYLRPEPERKGRNEPAMVRNVLRFLADLRQIDEEELAIATWANAHHLFKIKAS
ncbi:MAG: TatD family hydrolase [bacterium]